MDVQGKQSGPSKTSLLTPIFNCEILSKSLNF